MIKLELICPDAEIKERNIKDCSLTKNGGILKYVRFFVCIYFSVPILGPTSILRSIFVFFLLFVVVLVNQVLFLLLIALRRDKSFYL